MHGILFCPTLDSLADPTLEKHFQSHHNTKVQKHKKMKRITEPTGSKILDQSIRSTFGKLDDADITAIAGDRELLAAKLSQLYGCSKTTAMDRIDRISELPSQAT